jgi:hypothetical protein
MESEKLERERNLHIREMKRLQSEDKSRYVDTINICSMHAGAGLDRYSTYVVETT